MYRLYLLFFVSGFPALVYQVVWQRSLMTLYGVNSESVTVVVTAFLLGLGLGSLLGGRLSRSRRLPLLGAFGLVEIGIGLFGFASLPLFGAVGRLTLGAPTGLVFLLAFGLVLLPTLLMGATLPLLVEFLVRNVRNVGRSVGVLYAVNTLGSAVACFVAAAWMLGAFGKSGSVTIAAALNLLVGSGALGIQLLRRGPREGTPGGTGPEAKSASGAGIEAEPEGSSGLRLAGPLLLVALTGYIALSYEILWARVYYFLTGGAAAAFPVFLGAFLLGIALGSLVSRRFCRASRGAGHLRALAMFVFLANTAGFLTIPVIVYLAVYVERWVLTLAFVVLSAALLGATFPLLCHYAIPPRERAGSRLSLLYLANILGSVAGGMLTGFVLLDVWSLGGISVFLALLGLALALLLFRLGGLSGRPMARRAAAALAVAALVVVGVRPAFSVAYERLQLKREYEEGERFVHVVETRTGVITVDAEDRIYGGGNYDGAFSVDLVNDRNGIYRPYCIGAFHPDPRSVLQIGLSSGSWAQVLANHPDVERLTIIEIDEGYLPLIECHEVVASLLENPKVEIEIDDGRRWLVAHPERKFDLIVVNSTHHYRSNASNLLSAEALELFRAHLRPGGVHYYNTTSGARAQRTAARVFPHACRFGNMIVASDQPLRIDPGRLEKELSTYRIDGRPALDLRDPAQRARLEEIVARLGSAEWFEGREAILARTRGLAPVTDDNMGTEFTRGFKGPIPKEWFGG